MQIMKWFIYVQEKINPVGISDQVKDGGQHMSNLDVKGGTSKTVNKLSFICFFYNIFLLILASLQSIILVDIIFKVTILQHWLVKPA